MLQGKGDEETGDSCLRSGDQDARIIPFGAPNPRPAFLCSEFIPWDWPFSQVDRHKGSPEVSWLKARCWMLICEDIYITPIKSCKILFSYLAIWFTKVVAPVFKVPWIIERLRERETYFQVFWEKKCKVKCMSNVNNIAMKRHLAVEALHIINH